MILISMTVARLILASQARQVAGQLRLQKVECIAAADPDSRVVEFFHSGPILSCYKPVHASHAGSCRVWHTLAMPVKDTQPSVVADDAEQQPASDDSGSAPSEQAPRPKEIGGRKGPDPTRYGDWEKNGRCIDF